MFLQVEKLIYGGDALAREAAAEGATPERRKPVFVSFAIPGEQIEAELKEQKKGFARAQLRKVVKASAERTEPPCPYFFRCGGCHYQHISYEAQLRYKAEIVRETLRRTAHIDFAGEIETHASPPLGYRNRTRLHVRSVDRFSLGYYRFNSNQLLEVEQCPISSPLINGAIAAMWELGRAGKVPAVVAEAEFFADDADERMLVELYVANGGGKAELRGFAEELGAVLPNVIGVAGLPTPTRNGAAPPDPTLLDGEGSLDYRVDENTYRVSAGAFFQTNRFIAPKMLELVTAGRSGRMALDLYAGVGLFAKELAKEFQRVVAVESAAASGADLEVNVSPAVKVSRQSTEAYLASATGSLHPDLMVVDPPRAGLGTKVAEMLGKIETGELVYVSCDPATLARDLGLLTAAGWKMAEMHVLDMFPQTFHIETMTVLRRV